MRKSKAQTNNRKTEDDRMMIDTEEGMLGSQDSLDPPPVADL